MVTAAPSASSRRTMACPRAPVPPVTMAARRPVMRAGRLVDRGGRHHDGGALDLVVANLGDVEIVEVGAQLLERLLERGQGLARLRERRRAREQVVLHVRMVD